MKKILGFLVCSSLILSLAGCGAVDGNAGRTAGNAPGVNDVLEAGKKSKIDKIVDKLVPVLYILRYIEANELENKLKETRNTNEQLARLINSNISGESKIEKKRNLEMRGVTCKRDTYAGSIYVTVNFDSDGDLYEVLTTAENPGKNPSYDVEGISRLISYIMRLPGPISNTERKEKVLSLLKGLGESDKSVSAAIESAIESACRKKEDQ